MDKMQIDFLWIFCFPAEILLKLEYPSTSILDRTMHWNEIVSAPNSEKNFWAFDNRYLGTHTDSSTVSQA